MMWRNVGALIVFATFSTSCLAEDVCSQVLSQRAFDIYDKATQQNIAESAKSDICSEKWKSRDDFESRTRTWKSDFDMIDFFSGTGDADLSGIDHTIEKDYEKICQSSEHHYLQDYFMRSHTQIASHAVAAWEQCIKTTQQTGLWSRLELASDRSKFNVQVRFKPAGLGDKLNIVGYTHDVGYSCKINDLDAVNFSPADHGMGNNFAINCIPTDDSELQVSFTTSQDGSVGPYTIPSHHSFDAQAEIGALKTSVDALENRMNAADQALRGLQGTTLSLHRGQSVPAARHTQDKNWEADGQCPPGDILVQQFCEVTSGNASLQNIGAIDQSNFRCVWTNQTEDFAAYGFPLCLTAKLVK